MTNTVQHYAWGTRNDAAYIPGLLNIRPEPDKPYAELWMGAHPSGPSSIEIDGELLPLDKVIAAWPEAMLGKTVVSRFGPMLPFLFKVLSVAEPLSIQLHPGAEEAAALHQADPGHYPDPNHKPEIAIVIDSLTALAGCRQRDEIIDSLELYQEIAAFAGEETIECFIRETKDVHVPEKQNAGIQRFIRTILKKSVSESGLYEMCVDTLGTRLKRTDEELTAEEALFLKCLDEYGPDDMGLLPLFFLRRIDLEAGEALFLGPGIPHGYLSGNIVECMANSDNVVRLGLTGKYKDTARLPGMVRCCPEDRPVIRPGRSEEVEYVTPAEEFSITRWLLSWNESKYVQTGHKPEILLIIDGRAEVHTQDGRPERLNRGESVFVPALLDRYRVSAERSATVFRVTVPV